MGEFLIVGCGVLGAALAEKLSSQGATVTVVDQGPPASGATGASFGWVNASNFLNPAHFRLRAAGLAAWEATQARLRLDGLAWTGALSWEAPETHDAQVETLTSLGYPVERLGRDAVAAREPGLARVPEEALFFPAEAAMETGALTARLLVAALSNGVRFIGGQRVTGVLVDGDRALGVETDAGLLLADQVVLAAGTGSAALLEPLGMALPLRDRPAHMVVTRPVDVSLSHVLVTPEGEFRQAPDGRLLLPSSSRMDEATGQVEAFNIAGVAADALGTVSRYLDVGHLAWERALRAARPVPADGLPVFGRTGVAGLSLAVMHSGVTLAAVVADLMTADLLGLKRADDGALMAPFALSRFPVPV